MKPGHVLVVSCYFPPQGVGGAEVVAFRQAKLLQALGWRVSVFAADFEARGRPGGIARENVEGLDVYRARVKLKPKYSFLNPVAERLFARTLKQARPDVVHFHNLSNLGLSLIARAKDHGANTIVTLHDRWAFCFNGVLLRPDLSPCDDFDQCARCAERIPSPDGPMPPRLRRDYAMVQLGRADALVCPSRGLAEDFIGAGADPARIVVQSSGIDLDRIAPRAREKQDRIGLLCAGYLGAHKGVLTLAAALNMLWSDESLRGKWQFSIVGDGPLADALREALRTEIAAGAVVFTGRIARSEALRRLSAAHVVVLPSLCPENEPVFLLEGLASGAALVASRVAGAVELIDDGTNGLLCAPGDPKELAAALRALIVAPERIAAFSRENLRRRANYNEIATGAALEALYRAPPLAPAHEERLVACGLGRRPDLACVAVASAPHVRDGQRLRLLWWRWRGTPKPVALWVWTTTWNPLVWLRAVATCGARSVFATLRRGGVRTAWREDEQ